MQAVIEHSQAAMDPRELSAYPMFRRLLKYNPAFDLQRAGSPRRELVEQHIAGVFATAYGAEVSEFAPLLMSMTCADSISAAAGIRPADTGSLFIEQYLDAPIEKLLNNRSGQAVGRDEIYELGNLAAIRPGICQLFYLIMAGVTDRTRLNHVVFAGTKQVRKGVARLGFQIESIAPADPSRLGAAAGNWGSYYANEPTIMAINLSESMDAVRQLPLAGLLLRFYEPQIAELAEHLNSVLGMRAAA